MKPNQSFRSHGQPEEIRRRTLELLTHKLPFQILFTGFGVIIFLRGHHSEEIMVGMITGAIAIVAMYGRAIWHGESEKSKAFWFFGLNFAFWAPIVFIAPALGKFLLIAAPIGFMLVALTFVLEWVYQRIVGGKKIH